MNFLMKWTLFFAAVMLVMKPGHSATLETKTGAEAPVISEADVRLPTPFDLQTAPSTHRAHANSDSE